MVEVPSRANTLWFEPRESISLEDDKARCFSSQGRITPLSFAWATVGTRSFFHPTTPFWSVDFWLYAIPEVVMTMRKGEICEVIAPDYLVWDGDNCKVEIELTYFFRESLIHCLSLFATQ